MCVCIQHVRLELKRVTNVPPHGVRDAHGGTQEGREAKECDEDGGHLGDSVRLPGGLTVHHHTALWAEWTQTGVKSHCFHHSCQEMEISDKTMCLLLFRSFCSEHLNRTGFLLGTFLM